MDYLDGRTGKLTAL